MILTEEIIQLAEEYLEEWEADEDGNTWLEYTGTIKDIIDFAQKIYQMGYNEGSYDTSLYMSDENV
ncbi:MAG: hypothetical protein ACO3CQ_07030 [Candidatus Nanopelagicaceae bacterium]